MAKALLVDTNFSAMPLAEGLIELGYEVHVVGRNPTDTLAKILPNYHYVDYSNERELFRVIEKVKPDHLIPGGNDQSYVACARVNSSLQFTGIDSEENCELLNNKALFRVTAEKLGIPVPCTYDANHSLPEHTLIVKPVDSFSGKGITVVSTLARDALGKAISKAKSMSRRHDVVIEDFIDGQLYSHSAFINDGKIISDYWVIEHSSVNRFVVDTSHVAFDLSIEIKRSIQKNIERLVRHLDLKNGLLHTQFMVDKHRYFFIEVTRRCPGDLYSKLIQKSTGHNYALAYVAGFVGKPVTVHGGQVELEKKSEEYILRHTITQDATLTFRELTFSEKVNIAGLTMIASVGDILEPSPSGRVGIVFFRVSGREELTHLKQRILTRSLYHIH